MNNATATNGPPLQLLDIKPPMELPNPWAWVWWTLGLLLATGVLVAVALWIYRELTRPKPPEMPHLRAQRQLRDARGLTGDPATFCAVVSGAVRVYLEERFALRAPEQTTEEFLMAMQVSSRFNAAQKIAMTQFLQQCDLVKFARETPGHEMLDWLHASAVRLVEGTAPKPGDPPRDAS